MRYRIGKRIGGSVATDCNICSTYSAKQCVDILPSCGYSQEETVLIADAVSNHGEGKDGLAGILHRADRLSRICFECAQADKCKWDKLNGEITL